ncbi:MAG: response regulator [Pseudomonadota bacterium]
MKPRVVVFNNLLTEHPALREGLEKSGADCISVAQGKEVLPKVREVVPSVVILDVFMPQVSGMELCRQIKDVSANTTSVILVSSSPSETLPQRAEDYGCDLYVMKEEAEAKILEFLHHKFESPGPQPRIVGPVPATRFELSGTISYVTPAGRERGELINASESGILFAAPAPPPDGTQVTLSFEDVEQGSFTVETIVVRSVPLKHPRAGFTCAVGCKFVLLSSDDQGNLRAILDYSLREHIRLEPSQVLEVMDLEATKLGDILRGGNDPLALRSATGPVSEIERRSFEEENPAFNLIRHCVLLRVQTAVFARFIPRLETEKRALGPLFVPLLSRHLNRIGEIENEAEEIVLKAVAEGNVQIQKDLNDTTNRLHQATRKLLKAIDQLITLEGLSSEDRAAVEGMKLRLAGWLSMERKVGRAAYFEPSGREIQAPAEQEQAKPRRRKPVFVGLGIAALLMVFIVGPCSWVRSWVSSMALQVPMRVDSTKAQSNMLTVRTTNASWRGLSAAQRDETFAGIISYMKKQNLWECAIVDEDGNQMAIVMSYEEGSSRRYLSRALRE